MLQRNNAYPDAFRNGITRREEVELCHLMHVPEQGAPFLQVSNTSTVRVHTSQRNIRPADQHREVWRALGRVSDGREKENEAIGRVHVVEPLTITLQSE